MHRANRVRLLIGTAFDYLYGRSDREAAEDPGAAKRLRRGKGGVWFQDIVHPCRKT